MYKSIVRPVLTYAAEISLKTREKKRLLETAEMNVFRRMKGRIRYGIRSTDIRTECGIQNYQ